LTLLLVRSLTGAFGGVLSGLIMSIIGDVIPPAKRGRAMGLTMASFSVASVFGVPFGLALATKFDWHAPFLLAGGIAVLLSGLIIAKVPPMKKHLEGGRPEINPLKTLKVVTSNPNQLKALLFTILLMLSQFSLIPFISAYMVANVGFAESQLPWIYFIGGGLTIFTSPLVGRIADRVGKPKIFTIAGLLVTIPYFWLTHLGPSSVPFALMVTSLFFVIGNARFIPAMAMVTSTVRPETRGSFMSFNSSMQSLASGTAAFVSGAIVQKSASGALSNYNYVGYLAVGLSLLAVYVGRKLTSVES
jgi:predicted MFS family arabinose efflux permease